MDMLNNDLIESIVLCFGAQIGKTEAELNMIGFALHQSKAPVMMVYPTDMLAKFNSEKREFKVRTQLQYRELHGIVWG